MPVHTCMRASPALVRDRYVVRARGSLVERRWRLIGYLSATPFCRVGSAPRTRNLEPSTQGHVARALASKSVPATSAHRECALDTSAPAGEASPRSDR